MKLTRLFWTGFLLLAASVLSAQAGLIFNTNAAFKYFKGRSEASTPDATAWRQVDFDDTAWSAGNGVFYYGESLSGTLLGDMQGGYTTLYLRRAFVLTNLSEISALRLDTLTDDGHIVWINGTNVARFQVNAGQQAYTATATSAIEPTANSYTLTDLSMLLVGTNVLAVQALNASLSGSSDFVFGCSLSSLAPDLVPPAVAGQVPPPGTTNALQQITVVFTEPVNGVDASDLRINGVAATSVTGGSDAYAFTFPQPPFGPVNITWAAGHGIVDFGTPPNPFNASGPGATWQYTLMDNVPPVAASIIPFPALTVRSLSQIQVDFSEAVAGVDAGDLLINGTPSASLTTLSSSNYVFQFPPPSAGTVNVGWIPAHGISDLAVVPNDFAGGNWTYLLDPSAPVANVRINELVAANLTGLRDEDNEPEDWVELYNLSDVAVSLAGWALTDDPGQPAQWIFPNVTIGARGYLIVFCSGKDRRPVTPGSRLHTNFKLDPDGEYLGLWNAEVPRQLVSVFAPYPNQRANYSYGYDPANQLRYFQTPTPGTNNSTSTITGVVGDTKFSHRRGYYTNAFSLVITTATANATIRYTLNGIAPTATTGLVYTNPITITGTTVIRAAAYRTGDLPSDVDCQTYLFLNDIIRQSSTGTAPPGWPTSWGGNAVDYGMDPDIVNSASYSNTIKADLLTLPAYSLVMDLNDLFGSSGIYSNPGGDSMPWERPGSIELIYPEGADGFQINCGVRLRGGFSRSTDNPKHAFRFFFRQEYGQAKLVFPVFGPDGASEFDKFDLRTMQNYSWAFQGDSRMVCVRDVLARDQQLAMIGQGARGDFCHLYVNGQYWGLYNTEERPEAAFAESYFGGRAEDYDTIKVDPDLGYNIEATDGNKDAWTRLWRAATNGFAADADYFRIQGLNVDGSPNPAYENLLDMPNLVDYMLIILYGGNLDAPISNFLGNNSPNNWYGVRNRTGLFGGFRFFVHDSEHTLLDVNADRTGPYAAGDPAQGSSIDKSNPQYLWQRLQANAEFRMFVADRVQKHCFRGGALSVEGARALFLVRSNQLDRAIVGESARWGDAKTASAFTRSTWLGAMGPVASFINGRTAVLLNQLRADNLFPSVNAPAFNVYGGAVSNGFALYLTNTAGGGTLYYTLDGSDPRLRGGNVAGTALAYTPGAAIVINLPTLVRARVRNGTAWSPITECFFYPPQSFANFSITEIMYNPLDAGTVSGQEFEFLELKNTGTNTLDLSGMYFDEGIGFTFTNRTRLGPGQFFLLARNAGQFTAQHPGVPLDGVYTGHLDNSGERLTLRTPIGTRVLSVDYKDGGRWPITADGQGFSLVPRAAGGDPNPDNPSYWRASASSGGSPRADDPLPATPGILINEALTHTDPPAVDAIELYNPTAAAVDVGGWFLTDDAAVPRKFRIPDNTVIDPDGFRVFTEADFNPAPGTSTSFALGSTGESVYLLAADAAGILTGYSHGFNFGPAPTGVTYGRLVTSTGDEHFVLQRAPSLDAANAGPRVGPVVLRQIMYHPPDLPGGIDNEADEYLEIRSISPASVPLYDTAYSTNTWRLRGGVDFDFPPGISLDPGQGMLLVSFSPTNSAAVAAFRGKFGGLAGVPLFGPFEGKLDNSSDTVELQRPDTPDTNGTPYITVDRVDYRDSAPWPSSADGSGAALRRVDLNGYGDDPANWIGFAPLTISAVTPASIAVRPGTNAATATNVTFTVTAVGSGELGYQWRKGGVDLPGATNDSLSILDVQEEDNGEYSVRVTDLTGSLESAPVTLAVLIKPIVVLAPLNQTVAPGAWVTLSCEITGSPAPFTYEWRYGSVTLVTNISSERVSFFSFPASNAPGNYNYRVVVKNLAFTTPGVSHPQMTVISVLADTDADGLPDAWETANGLDQANGTDAFLDADGDGVSNKDEYTAGTDPRDPLSCLKIDHLELSGEATLTFRALSNKTYTVQYKDDLASPNWSRLADVAATATNHIQTVSDPSPAAHRIYRLLSPRSP